jgi:hypothetical protein
LQVKIIILSKKELKEIAETLDKHYFELLELMFTRKVEEIRSDRESTFRDINNIEHKIVDNKTLRVEITFGSKIPMYKACSSQINIKLSPRCLSFSVKENKMMKGRLKKDFDVYKIVAFLNEIGIESKVFKIADSKSLNGNIDGKQHTEPKGSNGFGKKPRSDRVQTGEPSRKQKKNLKKKKKK